ncbi:recombinase family protein [Desulforhabdus sp. TSK]|uniref:recombinase family protein n=1 Tax=Desulforhabdus sp. TSK TaxID=2925014 RepID=UPI001FC824A8|nr:recombinase family protein [Desulforhabdus sp. TSK]GKT08687.1 hypothetical protein DSTSK_19920 [Desulforhabdus sp. TSK]
MASKKTAVYLMVRLEELKPEDGGSYERPLAEQKEACLSYLKERDGGEIEGEVQMYTKRRELLTDIEREKVNRLLVYSRDRLGTGKDEVDGILYELELRKVELLTVVP